ncbi:surface protein A1 UspA1, partial [Moraxella bovoculi 237]
NEIAENRANIAELMNKQTAPNGQVTVDLKPVNDKIDALTTASNVLIDEIADNTNDIGKLAVISETTVDEVANNRAQIRDNKATIDALTTASNVLIDEIADNTNDIGKLAVISETTVDEVANNRAQIKDNHGKIAENKQALAQKADKRVVDAMRSFDTYLASLAGTNQGKINKLETAVADKADQATVDALTTASHVLIDEIADNTNDIGKLAVISETTVDEVANNRAQIRDNKAAITKNQADIATLISRTPAAVDLQPINDKIGALDNSLNDKINKLDDKLSAGVAGAVAIAMMPAPAAGSHYITGGTGFYNGENAVAVGLTGASETGTFTYKIGGSVNSSGSGTFGAGAGYRWK